MYSSFNSISYEHLVGYVKDLVFVPTFPPSIKGMKVTIVAALSTLEGDMLRRVWDESSTGWPVSCDTRGTYCASVRLRKRWGSPFTNWLRLHVRMAVNVFTGLDRPWGFQEVEALRFQNNLPHEGDKDVSPTHRSPLLPRRYSWY
jgi:hypothetical protein